MNAVQIAEEALFAETVHQRRSKADSITLYSGLAFLINVITCFYVLQHMINNLDKYTDYWPFISLYAWNIFAISLLIWVFSKNKY